MASAPKPSRSRKLPSPRNKELPTNSGGLSSKYFNSQETQNEMENIGTLDMLDTDEPPTRDVTSPSKSGVAYLTENLIRRLTKQENIAQVISLHVTLGKELNKKIKYIENLENLRKLLQLNLNNHMIEKIEKLDHLTQLRELHLANNRIPKIEGLDCLVHLTALNLNGNLIETLPAPVFKKLKELQTFHIAHNRIGSHIEVMKLRPLQDLSNFSMDGNPMSSLEHSQLFVIFQLRSLNCLDGKKISVEERQMADKRFAQEEVTRLESEINRQKKEYEVLLEENCQALEELQQLKKLNSEQQAQSLDQSQRIKELHRELDAKEKLLASKTSELSKACEKQFKLEQELAFYKLDAKFEHLGMLPPPDGVEFGDGEENESPYIGKARFKPNKFARKSNSMGGEQHAQVTTIGSRPSNKYDEQNRQVQQEIHDSLILDLQDKERAIQQAEDVLSQLTDQLTRRKAQLQDAGQKLEQIQQAIDDQAHVLGEEERKLIEAIADKKSYIRKLQEVAKELETRMKSIYDDLAQREAEAEKLRQTIRNTPPNDPAYTHLQARLAAKEQQLLELRDEYGKLKQDHDRAKERLQEEMAAVRELEAQLAALRNANGDQDKLKEELRNIIDDLNNNLNSMKQQVAQQARQINQLQHEKDALGQRLKDMQAQTAGNKQLKDTIAKLQQQLKLNEDALERERKNCEALRRRLSNVETQAAQGSALEPAFAEAKNRLKEAEAEVARLQNALNKLKQQLQDDRRAADERLRKEQGKVDKALQAARNAGDKDREVKELAAQVDSLTADNASLAQRLKDAEDELSNLENLLDKEEVLERLGELKNDINKKRSAVREPFNDQDDLGRALADLHRKYLDLMRDLETERRKQPDGELEGLQARLQDAERALKQARDRASQLAGDKEDRDAKLRKMTDELRKLKDKLGRQERLEDELERENAEHAAEMSGLEKQIAQLKDQLNKARHGLQDQLASARAPLQAKIEDMEDAMQHLQDKFNKVKADNDRLKAAIAAAEEDRGDLEDRLAEMKDKLREARARAEEANDKYERQKQALEAKVKALENELERAKNRLKSLRAQAEERNDKYERQKQALEAKLKALENELERAKNRLKSLRVQAEERLQAEKEKAAAKIDGLEDEIDGLKGRLRNLQHKAEHELDKTRDAGERRVRDLENQMADLRRQLDNERARGEEQLRRAHNKEAEMQNLLGDTEAQLQRTAHQSHAQQAKLRDLEDQIDGLRNALKEAQTQAVKDKLEQELEAVKAERMRAAIQAAADKQLADAQQQVASLQSLLDAKDKQLQEQMKRGAQNSSDIAAQRAEIRNLASALAEQNEELERLKEDLADMSRAPVHPQYFHLPDPSLTALANEVEALRAALLQKEQQVQSLTRPIPHLTNSLYPPFTTSGLATTPGLITTQTHVPGVAPVVSAGVLNGAASARTVPVMSPMVTSSGGLGTNGYLASPGQVHHHHYHSKKTSRGGLKPKSLTITTSPHLSPEVLSATTVTGPVSSSVLHHHHHYNDVTDQDGDTLKRKKRKTKKQQDDVLFCNFPNHEGLEYEVGRLEGILTSSFQTQKIQEQRDSLRMDLKELENEVEDSLKRRATARQSQRHSLDANLAAGTKTVYIMRAVDEEDEENFALKYLQQSSGEGMESVHSSTNKIQLDDSTQEARWERQLSELARVEGLVQKRKAELQRMDAVLIERRHELEDVVHKRKVAEGRLRRAEEDAGIIEERAAETSAELIRAGNQLINLEIKGRALDDRQEQIDKVIEAKDRELKDVENSWEVVRQNIDKLNMEMANKMEELENKESQLKDVESRLQLSLRVEELKHLVAKTEAEEKHQAEKYVKALKEGEKALEEKTAQLARTRNELQTQMIQFHELNSKINKLRAELRELQGNVKKGKDEVERLSQRREEEKTLQELNVKKAEQKLIEINNARNESMEALKSHREEFGSLRTKIHASVNKIKEYEELRKQKESEYKKISTSMNEGKAKLENELAQLKSEMQVSEESLSQLNSALKQVKIELETARGEVLVLNDTKDSVTKEINDLQQTLTEKRNALAKINQEIEDATKELEAAKKKNAEAQSRLKEMIEQTHLEVQHNDAQNTGKDSLPQESSTPKNNEKGNGLLVAKLQQSIKQLTDENEEQREALQEARTEVKELREFMKSERDNFQEHLIQMASKSDVYRTHLERLHIEYDAEKERNSREKDLLLNKAEEHRLKGRKLSEELSKLKQNHIQTKQELSQLRNTLAKDVKDLKEHIEGIATQMKSELARSLKQVESSKDETSDEFERLRGKKEEMEIQLIELQHSINTAKTMALMAEKEKTETSKREKEEELIKQKEQKFQRHQTYLTAQIRQQMSTRAEVLDEERKKAEASLEGLKSKLKNLEEVISRKDSSVQDFRLKLLRSKVEAEKAADSNKQIDELRRRLREVEDEKDLIKSQRNHLVTLNEEASLREYHGDLNDRKVKMTTVRSRRSLDSLTDDTFYAKPIKLEMELPCRDNVKTNTSLPVQFRDNATLDQRELNSAPYSTVSRPVQDIREPRPVAKHEMDQEMTDIPVNRSQRIEASLERESDPLDDLVAQNSANTSLPMSRKELSGDYGDTMAQNSLLQTKKPLKTERRLEKSAARPGPGTASSTFADDRKSEFLSSVHRLKNEKVKELELSLQRLFRM